MRLNVYEVFDQFIKAPSRPEKITVLRKNYSFELECVLRGTFHPKVKYLIENVRFKPTDALPGMSYSSLGQIMPKMYLFEPGHPKRPPNLTDKRMNELFVQMLESLEKREAEVLIGMVFKDLKVPGLDFKIVKEAFPQLL